VWFIRIMRVMVEGGQGVEVVIREPSLIEYVIPLYIVCVENVGMRVGVGVREPLYFDYSII